MMKVRVEYSVEFDEIPCNTSQHAQWILNEIEIAFNGTFMG